LGRFKTGSVSLKGSKLVLTGERYTLVRDSKKNDRQFAMGGEPMKLEIDLHGVPPMTVLPRLKEMLFADNIQELVAGLSPELAKMTPTDISNPLGANACHCLHLFKDSDWVEVILPDPRYVPPIVKSQEEPEFSDQARQKKKTGTVRLALFVDDTGRVGDVWILEPLGSGLDENAIAAVRKYVFAPAKYEGKPVGTELRIEIAFERH
jgi:TonB family protein